MIGLEDRRSLARDIQAAHEAGARLHQACEVAGVDVRTLQRWRAGDGLQRGDGRPQAVRPTPGHALSTAEREQILRVANEPRFADMPPARMTANSLLRLRNKSAPMLPTRIAKPNKNSV